MNFHYRIHSGSCHYVFYIITCIDIVLSGASVRRHHSGHESHCRQIYQVDRISSFLKQRIQYFIIPVDYGNHFGFERARRYRQTVMMSGLAVITTEFLIRPTIADRASALKTEGRPSYVFLVLHDAKMKCFEHKNNRSDAGFSLSCVNSVFLIFLPEHKINFRSHKKDSKRTKNRKICITRAWKAYKLAYFYFTLPSTCQARIMV